MNEVLKLKCDLLAQNYLACRKGAKLTITQAVSLAALLYTAQNKAATEQEIRNNRRVLKDNTSMFSNLQGYTNIALIAKMSNHDDPADYVQKVSQVYDMIKGKVIRTEYMTLAAQAIVDNCDPSEYMEVAQRTKEIYKIMQQMHPLLADFGDCAVAAILAVANIDTQTMFIESEKIYQLLKKTGFAFNKNTLQTISHIMALSDKTIEEKTIKFAKIRDMLKDAKHPIRWEQLAIIAAFCGTDIPEDTIVQEICDADDYLKTKKGFKTLTCGRQLRRLYACAMVLQTHELEVEGSSAAKASQLAQTTVQHIIHVIINAIIVATIVAMNNSHNSSK